MNLGKSVSKNTLENGYECETFISTNPFGETYLITTIEGEIVSGLIINDSKDGIECKNKICNTVKVRHNGSTTNIK